MNNINRCSRAAGEFSRADQAGLDMIELQLVSLLHMIGLDFRRGVHFCPSSRIWTCRSRGVRSYL